MHIGSTLLVFLASVCLGSLSCADDHKDRPGTGKVTILGSLQGEISAVKDGGWKIEVKYKDLVPYTTRATLSSTQGAAAYPRFRLPPVHIVNVKEKMQVLELRLLESTPVRFVPQGKSSSSSSKAGDKKGSEAKSDVQEKSKSETGTNKKSKELPGIPGEPSQLAKGQFVIVTVAREDFANFNRHVATQVVVLGER